MLISVLVLVLGALCLLLRALPRRGWAGLVGWACVIAIYDRVEHLRAVLCCTLLSYWARCEFRRLGAGIYRWFTLVLGHQWVWQDVGRGVVVFCGFGLGVFNLKEGRREIVALVAPAWNKTCETISPRTPSLP